MYSKLTTKTPFSSVSIVDIEQVNVSWECSSARLTTIVIISIITVLKLVSINTNASPWKLNIQLIKVGMRKY